MRMTTQLPEPEAEVVRARQACANCGQPMYGEFCYDCGQPKTGMIRHLSGIVADFLDSVFNIDSRTARTLWPLFAKPGYLSNEYFAGRRVRYVTPLRLYLFMSVFAFLAVAMVTHIEDNDSGVQIRMGDEQKMKTIEEVDATEKAALDGIEQSRGTIPDAVIEQMKARTRKGMERERERIRARETDQPPPTGPTPPERPELPKEVTKDNPNPIGMTLFGSKPWHPTENPVRIAWAGDTINAWLNDKVANMIVNSVEAGKHPGKFVSAMFSVAPQALLMILPVFALLLKIFYIFKRRLYMEHLIVALHSHSFLCFSILVLVLLNRCAVWTEGLPGASMFWGLLIFAVSVWIPIYLLLAQKRVYKQGWPMTLIKYFCIGMAYTMLLGFGIVLNLFWALASL
jgi:hypothetical protein